MKAGKIIGITLAVVIVAVIGAAIIGLNNINSIIKQAVETVGTQVIQTSVMLNAANFKITDGRGELQGLTVANPKGFKSKHAITLKKIALEVNPTSLVDNVIVVKEVLIDGVSLVAEQKGLADNNLQKILNNITQSAGKPAAKTNNPANSNTQNIRLMIEKLSFLNSEVKVITEKWGEKTLTIPNISLNNIGDKKTGLTPDQLTLAIVTPLLKQAKNAAEKTLKRKAKKKAKEKLMEKLSNKDKEKLEKLRNILEK